MGVLRRGRLAAACGVLTVAFALVVVGSPAPAGATNFYGFAGYAVPVNVTSLSAKWRIPKIATGSPLGHARTYIRATYLPSGVQMEVGTTEDEVVYHHRRIAVYSAFWNRIGFGPQRIRTLHAGDLVEAQAVKGATNWKLTFTDLTTHWTDSIVNPGVAATTITEASWLQEDPVAVQLVPVVEQSPVLPYPRVGIVKFTDLELNGRPPALPWSDALDLEVPNGTYLVPSHQAGDGFSISPATGAQRRFLGDIAAFNYVAGRFAYVAEQWTSSEDGAARFASAAAYVAGLNRLIHELSTQRWPAAARSDVHALVASEKQVVSLYDELPEVSSTNLPAWQATTVKVLKLNHQLAEDVHVDLGLPVGD